jgi:hypothetical protein
VRWVDFEPVCDVAELNQGSAQPLSRHRRLDAAVATARVQQDLPFLRESRDVADDEVMAPAVLAGDLTTAVGAGERFLAPPPPTEPFAPRRPEARVPSASVDRGGAVGDVEGARTFAVAGQT